MLRTGGLQQSLMLVSEFDEDILEAGSERANLGDGNILFQKLVAEVVKIAMVLNERMNGLPEDGGAANAGNLARETERARNFRRGDFDAQGALRLHVGKFAERIGRPIGDELAEINVGDMAAAFSFVHVMRGYEKRDAVAGKLEEEIPQLAARDGVDAGSGLVQKKKFWLVQHGAAECEALFPAAGELRGQAIQIGFEAIQLDNFVDAAFKASGVEAVDAAVELQVFCNGQIVI